MEEFFSLINARHRLRRLESGGCVRFELRLTQQQLRLHVAQSRRGRRQFGHDAWPIGTWVGSFSKSQMVQHSYALDPHVGHSFSSAVHPWLSYGITQRTQKSTVYALVSPSVFASESKERPEVSFAARTCDPTRGACVRVRHSYLVSKSQRVGRSRVCRRATRPAQARHHLTHSKNCRWTPARTRRVRSAVSSKSSDV